MGGPAVGGLLTVTLYLITIDNCTRGKGRGVTTSFCNISCDYIGIGNTSRRPNTFVGTFRTVGELFLDRPGGCSITKFANVSVLSANMRRTGRSLNTLTTRRFAPHDTTAS